MSTNAGASALVTVAGSESVGQAPEPVANRVGGTARRLQRGARSQNADRTAVEDLDYQERMQIWWSMRINPQAIRHFHAKALATVVMSSYWIRLGCFECLQRW